MRTLLRLVAGLAALALALVALITVLDGFGAVRVVLGSGMSDAAYMEGPVWTWVRTGLRLLEAGGWFALALGLGLGAAGSRARGIAGVVAGIAGIALVIAVGVGAGLGAGALADRLIAPVMLLDLTWIDVPFRTGLLAQGLPGLVLGAAGAALAVDAFSRAGTVALIGAALVGFAVPLRSLWAAWLFFSMNQALWGDTPWDAPDGIQHLLQLGGDGVVAVAAATGLVAVALIRPRPAPADG